jgi:hypothetical protein
MEMLVTRGVCPAAVFLIALVSGAAQAASLTVVDVNAPAINCVFHTNCAITVSDHVSDIPMPNQITGKARLQSRTYTAGPGSPAAGNTGYQYRVDLTQAVPTGEFACVTDLEVDFGPATKLQYNTTGPLDDVFVITHGGLGTIGLSSATETSNVITFNFSQPICAGDSPGKGATSFFFGLASTHAPKSVTAHVAVSGLLPSDTPVPAQAPNN